MGISSHALLDFIEKARQSEDPTIFRACVDRTMNILGNPEIEVATELAVSRTTIRRWRNGRAVPHVAMRRPVYAVLERRLHEKFPPLPDEVVALYSLGAPHHDKPRFEGDIILCGSTYDVRRGEELVARIFVHPYRYEGGRASASLNQIRWAGPTPEPFSGADGLFHDFVSEYTTAEETLPEVIRRCERIFAWRTNQGTNKP